MRARRLGSCILLVTALAACASVPPLLPRPAPSGYITELRKNEELGKTPTVPRSMSAQILAVTRSWLGEHDAAIAEFDTAYPAGNKLPQGPDLSQDLSEEAMTAILREAQTRQVVILNEAHHVPMHRAFAMRLARELRKLGFEYLACEAFNTAGDPNVGAVGRQTGFYVQDPVFAEFVRDARHEGWKLVPYEAGAPDRNLSDIEQVRQREQTQAKNLLDRILAIKPTAKVFIYVGYAHAQKLPVIRNGESALWMAGELKRLTGIDPLSIDQSSNFAHADPSREQAGYRAALARSPGLKPFVLRKADGGWRVNGYKAGAIDMQVFHPPQPLAQGRSSWLETLAERRAFAVPAAWMPSSGRRLVHAFHADDPADATPADIVLLEAGKPAPALMLPPGKFRYEFEDL